MTRDETIALFMECDAKWAEANAAGKSEEEAYEAAKAHWNAWAEALLSERRTMEAGGHWAKENSRRSDDERKRAWLNKAAVYFQNCLFFQAGSDAANETAANEQTKKRPPK
jgi:hypothetical protein